MAETDASALPEVPAGLEPLPELGEGVIGTRYRTATIRWRWVLAAVVAVLSVIVLFIVVRLTSNNVLDLIAIVVVVLIAAGITAFELMLALHGRAPVLAIDDERLRLLTPFNRVEIRLETIMKVTPLRRDLLIEAPGGIARRGRSTRARWAAIDGAKGLEVDRTALASYLRRRAEQAAGYCGDAEPGGAGAD